MTSSGKIAGVLLVFALLVIPSVAGVLASNRTGMRLAFGRSFAFVCSVIGLRTAFSLDTPAAPTILTTMGLFLILRGGLMTVVRRPA